MTKEIAQLLSESHLLNDGKVIDNQDKTINLDPKVSDQLSEDIKYMANNYGIEKLQPFFSQSIKDKTWSELIKTLGISNITIKDTHFNAWLERKGSLALNTENYKSFLYLPSFWNQKSDTLLTNNQMTILLKSSNLFVSSKNAQFTPFVIPLKPKLKEIIKSQKSKDSFTMEEMTITADNYKLLLNSVSGNYFAHNDSIHINNCDALLFLK
jgi:hypothetical protein